MKGLKEYSKNTEIKGIKIVVVFTAFTHKQACDILGISLYELKNYTAIYQPQTDVCIKNPLSRFAYFNSGEFFTFHHNDINKIFKYVDLEQKINEWRKIYPTFNHAKDDLIKK